ncbi:hypothetical protein [Syntrophomonas palmitatica]|uniref:hypothetical protein n=1 Tax=Syntrophomonas palmitatica TaxID=402877 RepID=UPI0006D1E358|nr:hypothetical protein [Syntrophomonas palmitatica]
MEIKVSGETEITIMQGDKVVATFKGQVVPKVEIPKKKPKYQIGDKVIPVSKSVPGWEIENYSCKHKYLFVNGIEKEKSCECGKTVYKCWHDKDDIAMGDYFLESDLRPYVEPPKFKFSVGNKVRAIAASEGNGWGRIKKGDIGIITHTPDMYPYENRSYHGKDRYLADFPSQNGWAGKEECFELVVDEPTPEPKPAFKVGDRVRVKEEYPFLGTIKGKSGIIMYANGEWWGVNFNDKIKGCHNLDGRCEGGFGYYILPKYLELLPINHCPENKTEVDGPLTFVFNGPATVCYIAFAGQKFKGVAKCAPDDTWSEEIGRKLAIIRAMRKICDAGEKD